METTNTTWSDKDEKVSDILDKAFDDATAWIATDSVHEVNLTADDLNTIADYLRNIACAIRDKEYEKRHKNDAPTCCDCVRPA